MTTNTALTAAHRAPSINTFTTPAALKAGAPESMKASGSMPMPAANLEAIIEAKTQGTKAE